MTAKTCFNVGSRMIAISGTTKDTQVGSIGSMEDVDKKFPRFRPH